MQIPSLDKKCSRKQREKNLGIHNYSSHANEINLFFSYLKSWNFAERTTINSIKLGNCIEFLVMK